MVSLPARVVTKTRCVRCPQDTHANSFVLGPAVINTHTARDCGSERRISQGACHTGGITPPAGTDVVGRALQRQVHEDCGRENPPVGRCGQHAVKVQVPSGLGHCDTPGPWADADTVRTSGPEMCASAHSVVPRTRTSGVGTVIQVQVWYPVGQEGRRNGWGALS